MSLSPLLQVAAILVGVDPISPTLRSAKGDDFAPVLRARLESDQVKSYLDNTGYTQRTDNIEYEFASVALHVLSSMSANLALIHDESNEDQRDDPIIGMKDVKLLRLLTSVIARWRLKDQSDLYSLLAVLFDFARGKQTVIGKWVLKEHLGLLLSKMMIFAEQDDNWKLRVETMLSSFSLRAAVSALLASLSNRPNSRYLRKMLSHYIQRPHALAILYSTLAPGTEDSRILTAISQLTQDVFPPSQLLGSHKAMLEGGAANLMEANVARAVTFTVHDFSLEHQKEFALFLEMIQAEVKSGLPSAVRCLSILSSHAPPGASSFVRRMIAPVLRWLLENASQLSLSGEENENATLDCIRAYCLRVSSPASDLASALISILPGNAAYNVLEVLKQSGCSAELAGQILVRWLAEARILENEPEQLLWRITFLQSLFDVFGNEILRTLDANDLLSFVAWILDVQAAEEQIIYAEENAGLIEWDDTKGMVSVALTLLKDVLDSMDVSEASLPLLRSLVPRLSALAASTTSDSFVTSLLFSIKLKTDSVIIPSAETNHFAKPYAEALELLRQDDLPVRAMGLYLLKQLVRSAEFSDPIPSKMFEDILQLFLLNVQEEDSFIYLAGVEGLVLLATQRTPQREEVIQSMLACYAQDANAVDLRLRVGEAIDRVLRRMGDAVDVFLPILLPHLLELVQSSNVPTTLRISTLNILTTLAKQNYHSLQALNLGYRLCSASLDILEVEMVQLSKITPSNLVQKVHDLTLSSTKIQPEDTPDVLSIDPKQPAFRRAAIHLFAGLFFSAIEERNQQIQSALQPVNLFTQMQNPERSGTIDTFSPDLMSRARRVLRYVGELDVDDVVRELAQEILAVIG